MPVLAHTARSGQGTPLLISDKLAVGIIGRLVFNACLCTHLAERGKLPPEPCALAELRHAPMTDTAKRKKPT